MPPRLTISKINKELLIDNYTCLSYDFKTKKFKYLCPKGHKGSMRMDHWRRGIRCAKCAGNSPLTFEQVSQSFEKEGYTLISTSYINSSSLLKVQCPNNHTFTISWNNWSTGYRCPECSGRKKKSIIEIKEVFKKEGYSLLTTTYFNNKQLLECVCPNNHLFKISWDNFNSKNVRCPVCSLTGISRSELELRFFIESIYKSTIIYNDRTIIEPKELDIYLPELKIAIEYNGLFWHSVKNGKDKYYHRNKYDACLKKDITLITIFEDEWLTKKDICKSRLISLINSNLLIKLYARKCVIKEISTTTARLFCEENHLQGYGAGASIKLGAFYEGYLVAVMTFARPSLVKGYSKQYNNTYELHRFCSKQCFSIIGIASKLLKYFEKNYICNYLISYADLRWSSGKLYEVLGFNYDKATVPNYWYFTTNTKRIYRYNLRKQLISINTKLTEQEYRLGQGYNIIWDCGNLKYVKKYR